MPVLLVVVISNYPAVAILLSDAFAMMSVIYRVNGSSGKPTSSIRS